MPPSLPYFIAGRVVKGFGRGGKQLGFPTANIDPKVEHSFCWRRISLKAFADKLESTDDEGVYYGWSRVDDGEIYPMVMSVGWNPQFANKEKTVVRFRGPFTCSANSKGGPYSERIWERFLWSPHYCNCIGIYSSNGSFRIPWYFLSLIHDHLT